MDFNEYQQHASKTADFSAVDKQFRPLYITLGVTGEAGELAEKVKKQFRDDKGMLTDERKELIAKEIGDVLWYLSQLAQEIGVPFERIAAMNIEKLADRAARGTLQGSGDTR